MTDYVSPRPEDVFLVAVEDLIPTADAENPNRMSEEEYARLLGAMRADAFNQPILVAERGRGYLIVDGEHRRRAAVDLGMTHIPAVVRQYTDEQVRAVRLGMNRNRGEVDLTRARVILLDLQVEGWSPEQLVVTGFSAEEIADLTRTNEPHTPDPLTGAPGEEPPLPEKPFVLEIAFADRATFERAKRALRKAAGKTKDYAQGLLNVLGRQHEEKSL